MKIVIGVLFSIIGAACGFGVHMAFQTQCMYSIFGGVITGLLIGFVIIPVLHLINNYIEDTRNRREYDNFEIDYESSGCLKPVDVPNQLLIDDDEVAYLYERISCYSNEEVPEWGVGQAKDIPHERFPALLSEGGGYGWYYYSNLIFIATDRRFLMVYGKGWIHSVGYSEVRRFDIDKAGVISFGKKGSCTISFAFVFRNPYISERILKILSKK